MELWGEPFTLGCLVLSYAWQYKGHPDPKGEVLKSIAFVLRAFVKRAERYRRGDKKCKVGVFWDYMSLPQRLPNGVDDRDEATVDHFKAALTKHMNIWYSHEMTTVLLVNNQVPSDAKPLDFPFKGGVAKAMIANINPYDTRGWCVTEMRMSSMVKDQDALLDLSKLSGLTDAQKARPRLEDLVAHGRGNRIAPLAPEAFGKLFREGFEKDDLRFTSGKVDLDIVIGIYKKSFDSALTTTKALQYGSLSWGDSQAEELAAALRAAGDPPKPRAIRRKTSR